MEIQDCHDIHDLYKCMQTSVHNCIWTSKYFLKNQDEKNVNLFFKTANCAKTAESENYNTCVCVPLTACHLACEEFLLHVVQMESSFQEGTLKPIAVQYSYILKQRTSSSFCHFYV